jgi:organic hydroperoxide reductase OsmC/OhrA
MKQHYYKATVTWTGNCGTGTAGYKSYGRDHSVEITGKPVIRASADPAFRGDPAKHNPEDLFLASLSSCHMLWYLHLCADRGIAVLEYSDEATGVMETDENGSGRFSSVTLNPNIVIAKNAYRALASDLHQEANKMCFIANSCNFPVHHKVTIRVRSSL